MITHSFLSSLCLCVSVVQTPAPGQQPTYWQDVRPIFRKHCTVCHSAKNAKEIDVAGGLALDSYEAAIKGGRQKVLTPGKSDQSRMVKLLTTANKDSRMPLDAPPLPPETIALIKQRIDAGAPEGTRPAEAEPVLAKKPGVGRKLDVALLTGATPPAGFLGDAKPGKLELRLKIGPLAPSTAVAFNPDGSLLATGSYGQVSIWDLKSVQPA